jgi:hypothetical protein
MGVRNLGKQRGCQDQGKLLGKHFHLTISVKSTE